MPPKFFVDTNVVAYAYDRREPAWQLRAQDVLAALRRTGSGAISTQVLGELYVTMIRPRRLNLPRDTAEETVRNFLRSWPVFEVTPMHVDEAVRGVRVHRLSYYDALIWATARLNGMPHLLSEDGQDGRYIEGVRYLNPFAPEFDMAMLS